MAETAEKKKFRVIRVAILVDGEPDHDHREFVFLDVDDILYVFIMRDRLAKIVRHLLLKDRDLKPKTILVRTRDDIFRAEQKTLKAVEKKLKDPRFRQIHVSILANVPARHWFDPTRGYAWFGYKTALGRENVAISESHRRTLLKAA